MLGILLINLGGEVMLGNKDLVIIGFVNLRRMVVINFTIMEENLEVY